MTTEALRDDLASVVGAAHVLGDPALMAGYERDWTGRFEGRAAAVVRPASTDEVTGVLRACARHDVAVVPQGGNTGLVGGSVPRGGEVVLSLTRIAAAPKIDVAARRVTVDGGLTLAALQSALRGTGLRFGVDLASRDSATIGGMVATNAGGVNVVRYGDVRAQVAGVEAVLADGRVLRRMRGLEKDNAGYDLAGLLCGSEGTLGVVTSVLLRLHDEPAEPFTALVALDGVDAALDLTDRFLREGITVSALELCLHDGMELVLGVTGLRRPFANPAPAYLVIESPQAALEAAGNILDEVPGVVDAAIGLASSERKALWAYRERHTEAINLAGTPLKLDVSIPKQRLTEFLAIVPRLVNDRWPSARVILFGHLAEANIHVNVLAGTADEAIESVILGCVAELGGGISAEHGIGPAKARWLGLSRDDTDIDTMRQIKRALDPQGILNPGAIFSPAAPPGP